MVLVKSSLPVSTASCLPSLGKDIGAECPVWWSIKEMYLPDLTKFRKRDYVGKLCYMWLICIGDVKTNREPAKAIDCDETTVGIKLRELEQAGLIEIKRGIRAKAREGEVF